MEKRKLMLGNEAIARGLVENGCAVATSYPGTPASEILSSLVNWSRGRSTAMHIQWAINEKVAFEIAYTASIAGILTIISEALHIAKQYHIIAYGIFLCFVLIFLPEGILIGFYNLYLKLKLRKLILKSGTAE